MKASGTALILSALLTAVLGMTFAMFAFGVIDFPPSAEHLHGTIPTPEPIPDSAPLGIVDGVYSKPAESTATSLQATPEPEENAQEASTPAPSKLGKRLTPARVGDTLKYKMNSVLYGKAELEITLTDFIRGKEAANIVKKSKIVNTAAPEGKEYVIAYFTIKNAADLTGGDIALNVDAEQFKLSASDFEVNKQTNLLALEDRLSAELYSGADTSGSVLFLANSNDECYAVFMDSLWFALFNGKTGKPESTKSPKQSKATPVPSGSVPSPSQTPAPDEEVVILDDIEYFWVNSEGSNTYHSDRNCSEIPRTATVFRGTYEEAQKAGKTQPCSVCIGE